MRMTWTLAEKSSHDKSRNHNKMGRKGRDVIPQHPRRATHKQEENYNCRFSPRNKPHRLPSLGVLHQEDEPPEHWALKASRACVQNTARAIRQRLLCEHTQNLTHSETQHRGRNLKGAWVRCPCWSWRDSWEEGGIRTPPGTHMLVAAISVSLFYHEETGAGKRHFAL